MGLISLLHDKKRNIKWSKHFEFYKLIEKSFDAYCWVRNNEKYELYSFLMNNARIINFIKVHGMVAYRFPLIKPELNKIETTFGS